MAKSDRRPEPEPAAVTKAPHVSQLPPGVAMHAAGLSPYATKPLRTVADPKRPPAGFVGAYQTCGGCGDYLPEGSTCAACAPGPRPNNVSMTAAPKMVAR